MNAVEFLSKEMKNLDINFRVNDYPLADDLASLELNMSERQSLGGDVSVTIKKDGKFAIGCYVGNFKDAMKVMQFTKLIQLATGIALKWEALHIDVSHDLEPPEPQEASYEETFGEPVEDTISKYKANRAELHERGLEAAKAFLLTNKKINAIKVYRQHTGIGLYEAKQVIDKYSEQLG